MQRKPDTVKKKLGTYRADRENTKKEVQVSKLQTAKAPTWLSVNAKKYFKEYFQLLDNWEILSESDLDGLAYLCYYKDRFIQIEKDLKKNKNLTYFDKNKQIRINPLAREQKNCMSIILDYSKRYGLTPVDRSGLKLELNFGDGTSDEDEFNI